MKTKLLALILMVVLIVLSLVPAVHAETWTEHTIGVAAGGPWYLMVYDIDSDTNPDVVVASSTGNSIYWYKAPPDPLTGTWTRYTINQTGGLDRAYGVFVHDMDGDNDPDVVASGYIADKVVWYECPNAIADRTIPGKWNNYTIGSADGAFCVYVADIDSDTNPDVVASAEEGDEVAWFKAPSDPTQTWTKYVIDSALDGARGIRVADMDGDGDLDVVAAAYRDSDVILYACPTPPTTEPWPKYTIDSALLGASNVDVDYIDGDGNPDVVATGMGDDDVVWYKAPDNPNATWPSASKRFIDENLLDCAWGVHIYSIDGWSTLDVVATATLPTGNVVVWYQGPEDPTAQGATWTKTTIDATATGARGVDVYKIDDDNDPDVVVSEWSINNVMWHEAVWAVWPIPEVPLGTILLLGTGLLIPGAIAAAKKLRLNHLLRK